MSDFIIVIDTREQNPFLFKNAGVLLYHSKLDYGDYSIQGFESNITIERKSMSDFLGSITSERERFKRELSGMTHERKYLVIENLLSDCMGNVPIKRRKYKDGVKIGNTPACSTYSGIHPNSIYGSIVSIMCRYNVMVYFAQNRDDAERFTLQTLRKFYDLKRKGEI